MEAEAEADLIRRLSPWNAVAFAARCTRRIQPLLVRFWRDAPGAAIAAVNDAVKFAEMAAAGRTGGNDLYVQGIRREAEAVATFATTFGPTGCERAVAQAAAHAVESCEVAEGFSNRHSWQCVEDVLARVREACVASESRAGFAVRNVLAHVWDDLTRIARVTSNGAAQEETSFFGTLWPDGEPEEWRPRSFQEHFTEFVRMRNDCTVYDDGRPDNGKKADFLLRDRTIVAELKCLEEDLAPKLQEFVLEKCKERGVVFYGELPFDRVFGSQRDADELRRQAIRKVGSSLKNHLKQAHNRSRRPSSAESATRGSAGTSSSSCKAHEELRDSFGVCTLANVANEPLPHEGV